MASTAASPLTQQARPSFQPKVVSLYEQLFREDELELEKSEGFWTEFFLLKAYPLGLSEVLRPFTSEDLLHMQPTTRQLFTRAIKCMKSGKAPMDESALDNLNVFLREIFSKKYTNISSDIILLLSGLDHVDSVFTEFVGNLDLIIKSGRTIELRRKAIQVALAFACGAFQTTLLSYFTHRDLFPALMKYINDAESGQSLEPFLLLGILSNYNKFEMQNPYQLRLDDFVNESTMQKTIQELGKACTITRADYIAIQDDLPEGWSLNNMLSYVGLTVLQGGKGRAAPPETLVDASKLSFTMLPGPKAAVLLSTYDFARANKLFCYNLVNFRDAAHLPAEPPISSYISLTSYLLQHAHRSGRCAAYARLNLVVLRILLEDEGICKRLVSDDTKTAVRLCRQRPPHLPAVKGDRILMTTILDTVTDGISHNLRKKLDADLYISNLFVLSRALSFLIRSRTKLTYHWSELWRALLSLLRFVANYAAEIESSHLPRLLELLLTLLARALTSSESFLPSSSNSDDLFYKIVENGDTLEKFAEAYKVNTSVNATTPNSGSSPSSLLATPLRTLLKVHEHYTTLINSDRNASRRKQLTPQQVSDVIKKGYESLEIDDSGVEAVRRGGRFEERYREVDCKTFIKKVARAAVRDCRELGELEAVTSAAGTPRPSNVGSESGKIGVAGSR